MTTFAFIITGLGFLVAVGLAFRATRRITARKKRALEQSDRHEGESAVDSLPREELIARLRERIVDEETLNQWETVPYETVAELIRAYRSLLLHNVLHDVRSEQPELFDLDEMRGRHEEEISSPSGWRRGRIEEATLHERDNELVH